MWRCTTFCMILMWLSLYMGKDLIRKTLLLPHNCQPGYRITSIPFWGQTYSLHGEPEAKYFSVTSSGDVITNSDIGSLLGRHITLIINNDLASEQWTEEVHITIGDGNTILQFPHNHYNGEINEHVPVGTMVAELDDLFAHRGVSFDDSISYELVSSAGNFPFRLQQDDNLSNAVRFITTSSLDKIRKDKYEVQVMAKSRDDTAIASVLILVTSDKQPKFLSPEYHVVISENTPAMSTITQLKPLNPNFKGKLHYSMEPHGLFKLNPSSGHLILRSRTMLEPLTYHLQVEAEDSAGQKGTPASVVVEVETMEDDTLLRYTPHSELSPHSRKRRAVRSTKKFEVPESLSGELIRLSDDSHERFAFVDTPPAMLEINRETGAVRLRNGYRLDYEDTPNIHFNVVVTKTNNREVHDELPVEITLTDENDESPRFVNVPRPFLATVQTNAPPGTSVYQLMATDDDQHSTIQYTLESGGEDRFEVDAETGIVRSRGSQPFRSGKEYEIGVSATDVAAQSLQKSATQSLKILVGERDPQFFESHYEATVPETALPQHVITEIHAYPHQGFPVSYELMTASGLQSTDFAIDANTGVIDLLRSLDYEKDPQQYHLRVRAIENGRPPRESTVNLLINVVDTNDNSPTFPLSQYIVSELAETIPNGTHIIQVTATDLDSVTNSQLTYSVNDGNFTVDSLNNIGYIKTAKRLDYDYKYDHTYNFTVIATDNGTPANSGMASVRISVTNVNDERPVFTQKIEHVQVSEDASPNTVVHVVQAYDPDGDDVSYALAGGERLTDGPFRIDPDSGIITLTGTLDKARVSYKLNITATDNGHCCGGTTSLSNEGLVIVEVKDINNNAPTFPDCGSYNPSVPEHSDVGTSVEQVTSVDYDTGANGNVSYSLVRSIDQDSDRFTIEPISGILRTAEVFDREKKSGVIDYGVTVKAEDHGRPSLAGFCTFRVRIGDINDQPPVFDSTTYETSIEESSQIGKRVIQVYATDKDAGDNGRVEYSLLDDTSGFFAVDRHHGWITVERPMLLRSEAKLVIEARDNGIPQRRQTTKVTILITKTLNDYPQWLDDYSASPILLSENVPVNHVVKRMKASSSGPDGTVHYVIQPGDTLEQNGNPRSFWRTNNDTTNEMELRVYRALDYETTPEYTLTIKAANRATVALHNSTRIRVKLIDKNDEIPQFVGMNENGRYKGSVAENMEPGATVITVTATDRDEFPDYRKISYTIKNIGPDYRKFKINNATGVITTLDSFDREDKNEYYITVVAQDGANSDRPNHYPPGTPNQGEAEVQIHITDKNDNAPFFLHRQYNASLPENTEIGTVVIKVTAEDEDEENQLTYSITGGNRGNVFEVVPSLGQIKIRGHLDYEQGPRQYRLIYRVFDEKMSNTATVLVKVTDVNDNAPRFDPAEYEVTDIMEEDRSVNSRNPKYLLTVHAYDPDSDRQSRMRYALTGQFAQNNTFSINPNTGEIYVNQPLDRDKPWGRQVWSFNVLAYDEPGSGYSLTGYAVVRVMPGDINDNAPVFDANRLEGRVPEHSRAGVSVLTVIATDVDKGENGSVTYSLRQAPARGNTPLFAINPNTGLITTTMNNALDREERSDYMIIVQATDQGARQSQSASATVTILITDINDHAPRFTEPIYQTTMSENSPNGASVTSVSATDKDIGHNARLTYTLPREEDRMYFLMTSVEATNTGVLKVHRPVDYDTLRNPFFNLTVQVTDTDSSHIDIAHIEVYVTDFNDNPPVFLPSSQRVTVFENVTIGTSLARFTATDRDTGVNRHFNYEIDRSTDRLRQFTIANNGLVTTAKLLDRETVNVHRVHILAIDKGHPAQTGVGTLIITLLDVNDNFPTFAEDYKPVIYENQEPGVNVITISAIDRDSSTNGPPFELRLPCRGACPCTDNPTCYDFAFRFIPQGGLNGYGSGIVTSRKRFDREKQKYYYMPIIMIDKGSPRVTGTNTLTITIGDRNDNRHSSGHKNIYVYNYKGQFRNAPIGNVHSEDADDWDIGDKTFTFDGTPPKFFRLNEENGVLTLLEHVHSGTYNFKVQVMDSHWKRSVVSTVSVIIREISDDAVYNSGSLRLSDITAEEFVSRPKPRQISPGKVVSGKSKYDIFREALARRLGVPSRNVDIFTVLNHPDMDRTCDIRYSAHGSPYYKPARLNGLVAEDKIMLEKEIGITISMAPVDECIDETCESGGCTNTLVTSVEPLLINTNGTSLVGITAYILPQCTCAARDFTRDADIRCRPDSCYNQGTCVQREHDFVCECPSGFDGPRCQQTHHSFSGIGWAWYEPLSQCEESHTTIEFVTLKSEGLLLYNGPLRELELNEQEDFIALELKAGLPVLHVNHGSGTARLSIDGRDRNGRTTMSKLNDARWHRIDIFRTGKLVRMMVDLCKDAAVSENERDQTMEEDRRPCETERETPGIHKYINVNTPLQLGGRANPGLNYPPEISTQGFDGCVRNLVHDGQLYDLHVGRSSEHRDSTDGCTQQDSKCTKQESKGETVNRCGPHGRCEADFGAEVKCVCEPGWRGAECDIKTTVKNLLEGGFIEWDFKAEFYTHLMRQRYKTDLQLSFRTRQHNGQLFKLQNVQKSEYMVLELKEQLLRFRYNLGSGEESITMTYANVSDGVWHTVKIHRIGKMTSMLIDGGEGRKYNETYGRSGAHHNIKIAQHQFFAGGDVKYPSSLTGYSSPIVDYDFFESCLDDIRFGGEWLPMQENENYQSKAAEVQSMPNVEDSCSDGECYLACVPPLECVNLWRYAECRCPIGSRLTSGPELCVNINECEEQAPCYHGNCLDLDDGFMCTCENGWGGNICASREEAYVAALSTGTILIMLACLMVVLILILMFALYTRRRRPQNFLVPNDLDDDVRENIINYDEEGVGEEDQDAYDISRLKKPLDDTYATKPPPPIDVPFVQERPKYRQPAPGEHGDVGSFILKRLDDADGDPTAAPHDSVHAFAYEGGGSTAGSLSSLDSVGAESEDDYNFLNDWGPRFNKLAHMYGNEQGEE